MRVPCGFVGSGIKGPHRIHHWRQIQRRFWDTQPIMLKERKPHHFGKHLRKCSKTGPVDQNAGCKFPTPCWQMGKPCQIKGIRLQQTGMVSQHEIQAASPPKCCHLPNFHTSPRFWFTSHAGGVQTTKQDSISSLSWVCVSQRASSQCWCGAWRISCERSLTSAGSEGREMEVAVDKQHLSVCAQAAVDPGGDTRNTVNRVPPLFLETLSALCKSVKWWYQKASLCTRNWCLFKRGSSVGVCAQWCRGVLRTAVFGTEIGVTG